MINLTKGQTQTIYFTATEQSVLTSPFFLFICESRGTGITVKFIATNTSEYTDRYDKAVITTDTYFEGKDNGLWTYRIYEQASSTNLDPTGLTLVEEGLLNIIPATPFAPTEYEGQDNTFKTYGE